MSDYKPRESFQPPRGRSEYRYMARFSRTGPFSLYTAAMLAAAYALGTPTATAAADRGFEGGVVILATSATERGIGAGTVLENDGTHVRIVTAKHVATFGALAVELEDGTRVPARIERLVASRDLAIVDADVDPSEARTLRAAPVAAPLAHAPVHVWGSGNAGPALETGVVADVAGDMPDGSEANGRYTLDCKTCHRGDSGAGIFDGRGELVGVYIGYFNVDDGSVVHVAETPAIAEQIVRTGPSTADVVAVR